MFWDFLKDRKQKTGISVAGGWGEIHKPELCLWTSPGQCQGPVSRTSPGVDVDSLPPHVEKKQGGQEELGGGVGPGRPSAGEKTMASLSVPFQTQTDWTAPAQPPPPEACVRQRAWSVYAVFLSFWLNPYVIALSVFVEMNLLFISVTLKGLNLYCFLQTVNLKQCSIKHVLDED